MWFDLFLWAYILYCLWLLNSRRPIEATIWYYLVKDWQAAAAYFGRLAIDAEAAYHIAIRRASLA